VIALGARIRAIPSWQITLGIALLALGFLIAAQLRAERPRVRYTTQERPPLVETVLELQRQQDQLKDRILELRAETQLVAQAGRGSAALVRDLNRRLDEARMAAGLVPLTGTGLVYQLDNPPVDAGASDDEADRLATARDIRTVVEELWLAGAEAIAINGERLTAITPIVDIGGSILVNQAYLAPPYQISAIGPSDLYARMSASQGYLDFVAARVDELGIQASFGEFDDVSLPAFAGTIRLDHGRPQPSEAP
jgi:uncharacterized protein YlxW (UPF0749 family)